MKYALAAAALIVSLLSGCPAPSKHPFLSVVGVGARVELVQEGFVFTEGPLPMPDGGLLFTDYRNERIYRLAPDGKISVFREKTNMSNGLAYLPNGDLIAAEYKAKRVSVSGPDGRNVRDLTTGDGAQPLVAINDLIADSKGGVYFTDPHDRPIPAGRKVFVYYLPPGAKQAKVVDDSMIRPNGLTLTLDGKTLIVADTVAHDVTAFDVQPDGSLKGKRAFARLRGIADGQDSGGDGVAIDREGRIYVTSVPGVQVFDKRGQFLGTIPVPRRPTNVAFSGPGKRTLYITAREGLYRVVTLTQGPERPGK